MFIKSTFTMLIFAGLLPAFSAHLAAETPQEHYEKKIRPLLIKHCYECHSASSKEPGGKLKLDSTEGMKTGGESGPLFDKKKVEESLILHALKSQGLEMPPDKPLNEAEIFEFEQWIKKGGYIPVNPKPVKPVAKVEQGIIHPKMKSDHWAFQGLKVSAVPVVKPNDWVKDPVDQFILARMKSSDFSPAPPATPAVLVRRLYLDLTGLLPDQEQVVSFEKECSTNRDSAITNLVDRLLASPHFGERWGRHWLDVARYAESNGNDGLGRNHTFPNAWRYRDYVIDSMNRDVPYDQFIKEQIAGDLLPAETPEIQDRNIVATGFLALTAKPAKAMNDNFDMDVVADQLDVIGKGMLGLSIGCARCHDHKFDPIPTREYYALAGIFTNTETLWGPAAHEGLTATATDLHVLKAAPKNFPPQGFVETVLVIESDTGIPKPVPKSKWPAGTPLAMGLRDKKKIENCKINIKGESKQTGEVAPRGFLSVCTLEKQNDTFDDKSSGRLQLAEWITHPDHPLTARVFVNRVWMHLMGNGIVQSVDDFGTYGDKPTHPELLDFLAIQFRSEGWSAKKLIRHIVLSNTYQQQSLYQGDSFDKDPQNLYYSRYLQHRMDAETLRDCMLQVCQELETDPKRVL